VGGGKGRAGEKGRELKVKRVEGGRKWREAFGPHKNFGVDPWLRLQTGLGAGGGRQGGATGCRLR